jgi:hypothetical protein
MLNTKQFTWVMVLLLASVALSQLIIAFKGTLN